MSLRHPITDGRSVRAQIGRDIKERRAVGTEQPLVSINREHVRIHRGNVEPQRAHALRAVDIKQRACPVSQL